MRFRNRKAGFNYHILEEYEAGLVLFGSEVKSLRTNGVNFGDSFITITGGVPILRSIHISKYEMAFYNNHEEMRDRTLLLNKREIKKLKEKSEQGGLTIVPIEIFEKNGFFKVKIALCRGKKNWDKKISIKERDLDREVKNL